MGQGTIPSDWEGEYCCYAVQWPDSPQWLAVLRGCLALPATGRFWDESTGIITEAQAVIGKTYDNNLHLEEVLMSCNDDTNNALNNIAIALTAISNSRGNTSCCSTAEVQVNNSIQGIAIQPNSGDSVPLYGSTPPLSVDSGNYPEGYESLEEYETDKCRKANSIVNSVIVSCRAMGTMDAAAFAGLTAVTLMGLSGVLVIAPELIPFLIAALIVLAVYISVLDSVADYLVDNKEEFVCILYNGDSSSFIISALADAIDLMIVALSFSSIVGGAVKVVLLVLFNVDVVNFLFTNAPMFGITEIECTACDCDILTTDFTDSDNDYTYGSDSCFGTTPSSAGASVSWSATGLAMLAPNVGSANFVKGIGPSVLNIEVLTGWELVLTGHRVVNNANFTRIDCMTTEDGCTQLQTGGFTSTSDTQVISSLDAFSGKHIESINIFVGNSIGQEVSVEIVNIMIRCAE